VVARRTGDALPAGGPWPAGAAFGPRGLEIRGAAATELARAHGTPLLVVDEAHVRERARLFGSLFPHVLYAVKAFTSHAAIRLVLEEGLDLLASTDGELEACLRAGAPGERIVLHGNNKSDAELALAVEAGVRLVNVDNEGELERLEAVAAAAGAVQPVLLRVIPEVGAGAHEKIRTGGPRSKFGTPLEAFPALVARALELPHVRPVGVHAHIGSQVLEAEPYLEEVDVLLDLLARLREEVGFSAEWLDLGGGFGVAYTDERPFDLAALAPALLERVRTGARARGLAVPHTVVEPGRSVVGAGMVTLYRVGTRKEVGGRRLLAVDGGMSDNIRPMLYGARYTVALAGPPRPAPTAAFDVVGRHCESGDVLAEGVELPADVGPGDLLAFAATGAYTYSMASNYNRVGRPAVVAVGPDGAVRPWLRREDAADLDRLEAPAAAAPEARPPAGVEVRPARPADAPGFLEVFRVVAAEGRYIRSEEPRHDEGEVRRRFRRSWGDDRAQVVAVADGRVVGHLDVERERHPVTRHVATLGMLVLPAWRGRGVGAALLAEAFRWAREVGVEKLSLTVYPGNRAAIRLYRRFGFVEEGRLRRHSKKAHGYEDEIVMGAFVEAGP
ncbi:MAG TPA: diaminopimelate decarboxylase, partial [Actinomycetota bacterium]|nr:diaminopimelate decarboxylase [Actinomycetota bacterium]